MIAANHVGESQIPIERDGQGSAVLETDGKNIGFDSHCCDDSNG